MKSSARQQPMALDLVLIGCGHAHVHCLKMLGMHHPSSTESYLRVTLISSTSHTPYSGMLPGYLAGHYTHDDIHLDCHRLARFAGARLILAQVCGIIYNKNGSGGTIQLSDGRPPLLYDCLSINIGSAPSRPISTASTNSCAKNAQGNCLEDTADAWTIPVKPIATFTQKYHATVERFQKHCDAIILRRANQNPASDATIATESDSSSTFTIAVVGGGAGGVELALAVQYRLQQLIRNSNVQLRMVLVTRGDTLLQSHNRKVQAIFRRICHERQVQVFYNTEVVSVENDQQSDSETQPVKQRLIPSKINDGNVNLPLVDACFWCVTAGAADWLHLATPFAVTTEGNFLRCQDTYQLVHHPGVFAAGDCCHMDAHPRPKAGVFAVRAGPILYENLLRYCTRGSSAVLLPHRPQSTFLGLISTGDRYAIASKGSWFCMEGAWLWKVKDYIDRSWMAKYSSDLPDLQKMMEQQSQKWWWDRWFQANRNNSGTSVWDPTDNPLINSNMREAFAADPMRCGGCGAKVGSSTVARVLKKIHQRQVERAARLGLDDPHPIDHDDAAVTSIPQLTGSSNMRCLQTIDYFRELIQDPYVFGQIVSVHALSDLHAMGSQAHTALALAVVPYCANESLTEDTLVQLLSGVSDILQDEGVQLVGGHTCEGLELACGLSLMGFSDGPLWRKRGGRVGDCLVLTKPLGSGALFAAEMRARCTGLFVQEAVESMTQSSYAVSHVARSISGVHACTDITGFGLMGHLLEMLLANDQGNDCADGKKLDCIAAVLQISDIPFYRGGLEASANGIYSSLQNADERNRRAVSNHSHAALACPVEYPLLYDPQTAGGLLFFVDPSHCLEFVRQLREVANVNAAVIGELEAYTPWPMLAAIDDERVSEASVCVIGRCEVTTQSRIRIAL